MAPKKGESKVAYVLVDSWTHKASHWQPGLPQPLGCHNDYWFLFRSSLDSHWKPGMPQVHSLRDSPSWRSKNIFARRDTLLHAETSAFALRQMCGDICVRFQAVLSVLLIETHTGMSWNVSRQCMDWMMLLWHGKSHKHSTLCKRGKLYNLFSMIASSSGLVSQEL